MNSLRNNPFRLSISKLWFDYILCNYSYTIRFYHWWMICEIIHKNAIEYAFSPCAIAQKCMMIRTWQISCTLWAYHVCNVFVSLIGVEQYFKGSQTDLFYRSLGNLNSWVRIACLLRMNHAPSIAVGPLLTRIYCHRYSINCQENHIWHLANLFVTTWHFWRQFISHLTHATSIWFRTIELSPYIWYSCALNRISKVSFDCLNLLDT